MLIPCYCGIFQWPDNIWNSLGINIYITDLSLDHIIFSNPFQIKNLSQLKAM